MCSEGLDSNALAEGERSLTCDLVEPLGLRYVALQLEVPEARNVRGVKQLQFNFKSLTAALVNTTTSNHCSPSPPRQQQGCMDKL